MAAERSKPQSATELPRFDGQYRQFMNLGGWLRALWQQEHLLPSDLSYFTKTGAQVMNNGKVAVASVQHALLLHGGVLAQCDFSITRPPPVGDRFVELYRRVRLGQDGLISAGITLLATINSDAIPDEYSDIYHIRPQSIAALDLKLRDDLLSLTERREFYKGKMQPSRRDSGLHLLDRLLDEQARADSTHAAPTQQ